MLAVLGWLKWKFRLKQFLIRYRVPFTRFILEANMTIPNKYRSRRCYQHVYSRLISAVAVLPTRCTRTIGLATFVAAVGVLLTPFATYAQGDVLVRVVDVGAGLCTVTRAPGPNGSEHFMIFDAGSQFPFNSTFCVEAVKELVGTNEIDLMIISHPDADHVVHAAEILDRFSVRRIIRTGHERDKTFWRIFDDAVEREEQNGADVTNLANDALTPGIHIPLGGAVVTLVAGWHDWIPPERFDSGEERNVISIVARLEFDGRSVLFTGDTIGRRKSDNDNECKNAEEYIVANSPLVPVRSNVMIAPHHGGNNGSSSCFIEAVFGSADDRVVPRFVVFSAGHEHGHPTLGAAGRYQVTGGVSASFIRRTDRGDDELSQFHFDDPDTPQAGCEDGPGDDTIDIVIRQNGQLTAEYRGQNGPCL